MKKYRIVRQFDNYKVQVWRRWFPLWVPLDFARFYSPDEAIRYIKKRKNKVVLNSDQVEKRLGKVSKSD